MAKTVTIELEDEAAELFRSASDEERKRMELLLSLWLREYATGSKVPFDTLLDQMSDRAEARGLTRETLDSLLHDQ